MREKEFLSSLNEKYGIMELSPMQRRMLDVSSEKNNIILLSPTGSGKTLAYVMTVLKMLKPSGGRCQAVIIAPSRELVIQIAEVFRSLAPSYKVSALYGGHKVEDEKNSLKITPDIIVATPGRFLDHLLRRNVNVITATILVLDEFDKILELGFYGELKKICARLKNVSKTILTSATKTDVLPDFLRLENPLELNYLGENCELRKRMRISRVETGDKDKLETLHVLLRNLSEGKIPDKTIIFVNHRESAERVAEFLKKRKVDCVLYHGTLDQRERETAIVKFNNGSAPIMVATDLAARGLDIEGVKHIIHYHQALSNEIYTHRNGRSARVKDKGEIFVLIAPEESVKDFTEFDRELYLDPEKDALLASDVTTVSINAGKKEKISKGDIVGFLIKECGLEIDRIGRINVFDHYALFAITQADVPHVIAEGNSKKLKGKRRKFSI